MHYAYAVALILINALFLFLQVLGLPGNWLMVFAMLIVAWLRWDQHMFSPASLIAVVVIAIVGEILEFLAGAMGTRKAGGSRSAATASIFGAILGGIVGTLLIPIPILGSLIGVCAGAFLAAMSMELLLGRKFGESFHSGRGAAVGRLWGTAAKILIGVAIYITIAVAAFWP